MLWHPTEKGWALGVNGRNLYITQDYTATWRELVRDSVTFATWCNAGQFNITKERICMISDVSAEELGLPPDTKDGRVGPSRFIKTDDFTASIEVMFAMEVSYLIVQQISFLHG
jgi:hypothetical protein